MTSSDSTTAAVLKQAVALAHQRTAARLGGAPVEDPPTTIVFDEGAAVFTNASRLLTDPICELIRQSRSPGVHVPRRSRLLHRQYLILNASTTAMDQGEA
jgi:hypothetical protein